jgi:hypothetical protein
MKLREENLKLNPRKSEFTKTSICFKNTLLMEKELNHIREKLKG